MIFEKQPEKSPEKSPEQKKKDEMELRLDAVYLLMKNNPSISRSKIAMEIGISDSQAKTAITKLKEKGLIRREGSDTNGVWVINDAKSDMEA